MIPLILILAFPLANNWAIRIEPDAYEARWGTDWLIMVTDPEQTRYEYVQLTQEAVANPRINIRAKAVADLKRRLDGGALA